LDVVICSDRSTAARSVIFVSKYKMTGIPTP